MKEEEDENETDELGVEEHQHRIVGQQDDPDVTSNQLIIPDTFYKLKWLGLALLSACLYAAVTILSSTLSGEIDPALMTFSRAFLSTILAVIVACYDGTSLAISSKTDLRFHVVQSTMTAVNIFCQFYAYQNMPASDASTIVYGQVIFVGLFGRVIYKEPFALFEIIAVCIASVGIVLIARPSFLFQFFESGVTADIGIVPPLVAIAASVSGAGSAVHVRAMELRNITGMSLMFYSMLFTSIILAVPLTLYHQWSSLFLVCRWARTRLFMTSISAFAGYALYNYALKFENSVYVSLVVLNNVLIVFVVTILLLDFTPNWISVVGMFLILGSCAVITLKKAKVHRNTAELQTEVVSQPSR